MPFVDIRLTGDEEAPTKEQKAALIKGVTDVLVDVLGKSPEHLVVLVTEVPMDSYGIAGKTVRVRREEAVKALKV